MITDHSIKQRLQEDMKTAMRARDQAKLGVIRFILAAIKQQEVDQRITLDDAQTIAILEKLVKQRRDSIQQFQNANRDDLVKKETFELGIVQEYLPEPLSEEALNQIIQNALKESGAASIKEMGKVMAIIKPQVQGRADMGNVSAKIKTLLSN